MSDEKVVPYEVHAHLLDGALAALKTLGPTGDGSIIHDQVPEDRRDLAWWVEEWGWTMDGTWLRGIYGDWTDPEDDEKFFTALAPHVGNGGLVICGDEHGYDGYFAWVFEDGAVERRHVRLRREFDIGERR